MTIKKFQTKISFWAGFCLLLTASFIVTSFAISMNRWANDQKRSKIDDARRYATATAKKHAYEIKAYLEVPLDSARTLAQTLSGIQHPDILIEIDRQETSGILKIILSKNPHFHAVYTGWEPNAFDDMDRGYINDPGHDETGRYIPYWYRNENDEIALRPLSDYDHPTGTYYQIPKSTHQECILNPIYAVLNDQKKIISSMISPIKVGDEFYGIVGIDLELDYLQNKLKAVESNCQEHHNHAEHNCHQEAHVLVLSQDKTIAATTSRPSFIGMKITDINYDRLFDDQQIEKTDKHINDNYLDVETPIILGQTSTAWSVKVIIPTADILAKGQELKHAAEKELYQMVVINIIGVMFFMFIVWYSAGNLSRPIKMGADALESIAEGKGDLTQRLPVHSKDEAGQMSLMFNRFMDNLQELVLGIVNGLNTLSEAVNNISSSIERQVTILSQQSASVTEITGTMSELTTSSTQIADHAGRVADLSETTLVHTKKGRDIVQEMQDRINNIYDENNRNVQEILALGKKSKEVNKVIEIINNITDQTKLIAFNAALEASSAGDSGKRFGVVAVEIRRLADSVIDSTRETESIINEIDESVNRMIIESENRGKSITKGLESASNTSETFMQIVSSAQTTTDASHQISLSTQQQKTASEQVISALREIDEGVKQSTQSMKAIRSICNELQNLSNKLRGLVSQFNVLDQ